MFACIGGFVLFISFFLQFCLLLFCSLRFSKSYGHKVMYCGWGSLACLFAYVPLLLLLLMMTIRDLNRWICCALLLYLYTVLVPFIFSFSLLFHVFSLRVVLLEFERSIKFSCCMVHSLISWIIDFISYRLPTSYAFPFSFHKHKTIFVVERTCK